ncbi:MAG: hypothetical protein EU531_07900 [Promethearchaeota archaeon]|nr:MAG: hypothetical protein EU531_07900 [Candidatus Lokiarchaeota archaeon]
MSRKHITLAVISIILLGMNTTPLSLSQITIYDSSFPLEQGKSIRWETINATEAPYTDFPYIRFRVNDLYNDTWYDGYNSLIVNATIEFYHNFGWVAEFENSFYLAYNYSRNYLNWSEIAYLHALPLIVPTPVNLTLIGDAIENLGILNYSYIGSTLLLDYQNTTTVEITYNSKGISTIIEKVTNMTTMYRWELVESEVVVVIPFTNYFIVATIIASISLIWFEIKVKKNHFKQKKFKIN